MPRLSFQTSLLLAPLAYAIHHGEEHILFNFREWRLRHFPDNNALSTETVLAILMGITMVYLLLHATIRKRETAWVTILFLMATQTHNAIYHLGGTIVFADFSPGLITALILYVPVSILIARAALAEGLVTMSQLVLLFVAGGILFWAFEFIGPIVLLVSTLASWLWAVGLARTSTRKAGSQEGG